MSHSSTLSPAPDSQVSNEGQFLTLPGPTPPHLAHVTPAPRTPSATRLVTSRDINMTVPSHMRGRTALSVTRQLYGIDPETNSSPSLQSSPSPFRVECGTPPAAPAAPDFKATYVKSLKEKITYLEQEVSVLKALNGDLATENAHLQGDIKKTEEELKKANAEVELRMACQDRLFAKISKLDAALIVARYQRNFAQHLALSQTDTANALHELQYNRPLPNAKFIQTLLNTVPDSDTGEEISEIILSSYVDYDISMTDDGNDDDNY